MKVLYIGGTGEISYACVLASLQLGHHVTVFNRGTREEKLPDEVAVINGDLTDDTAFRGLARHNFDVVCQFLAFQPKTVQRDIEIFTGHCAHYVFVSSASAYLKPGRGELITEATPLENPFWAYSRSKAACERLLHDVAGFSATIIRPSHTYRNRIPSTVIDGDHLAWRLLRGKPVIVHDGGESLWTLTHAEDFARAFTQLLGSAGQQTLHITDSEAYTWNEILSCVARSLGVDADIRPVAAPDLIRFLPELEGPLYGDKANSMQFDNARVQGQVPGWQCEISLAEGVARTTEKFLTERSQDYTPDPQLDALLDQIVSEINHSS